MNRLETDFSKCGMFSNPGYLKYLQYGKKSHHIPKSALSKSIPSKPALLEHVDDQPVNLSLQFLFR